MRRFRFLRFEGKRDNLSFQRHSAWTCSIDMTCNMDLQQDMQQRNGHAARTCNMKMQYGHAAWTCSINMWCGHATWIYTKEKRHKHAGFRFKSHAAWTCSKEIQQGHIVWTWNVNMQHRHAARLCSIDMISIVLDLVTQICDVVFVNVCLGLGNPRG